MGLFPTDANDGDEVTNTNGTTFKYVAVDDKWIIVNTLTISDLIYNAANWDANTDGATKNAIRDKIELLVTLIAANCTTAEAIQAVEDTGLIMNALIKGVNNANFIIELENALTADHTYHGTTGSISTNGGSFGIPMYSDTTAYRVSVCVDTSINTMPCMGVWVAANKVLTQGFIRDNTWNFTIGKPVYVNGSVFSTVIPPTVGDIVQVVGVSITADIMHFNPSYDWVVRK